MTESRKPPYDGGSVLLLTDFKTLLACQPVHKMGFLVRKLSPFPTDDVKHLRQPASLSYIDSSALRRKGPSPYDFSNHRQRKIIQSAYSYYTKLKPKKQLARSKSLQLLIGKSLIALSLNCLYDYIWPRTMEVLTGRSLIKLKD